MNATTLVEATCLHPSNKTSVTKSVRGAAATKNFTARQSNFAKRPAL
jgi:hypothetical protein